MVWYWGPKALKYESLEPQGQGIASVFQTCGTMPSLSSDRKLWRVFKPKGPICPVVAIPNIETLHATIYP